MSQEPQLRGQNCGCLPRAVSMDIQSTMSHHTCILEPEPIQWHQMGQWLHHPKLECQQNQHL